MKKTLFTSVLLIGSLLFTTTQASAQGSSGLVAHWDFNGTTNDVTGNSNDGIAHNLVSTTGRNGLPNTAYYFAGVDTIPSYVQVPFQTDLNLTNYSICATIKVLGFNSNTCQTNTVLSRGHEATNGRYGLGFGDNPFDGSCSIYTPDSDVFQGSAGLNSFPNPDQKYSPTIAANQWISVVLTYDGTNNKLYVDGALKYSVNGGGYAIGTSTEDLFIGSDMYNALEYHYPFTGIIDDIRLYNRVLSSTEIMEYNDSSILGVPNVSQNTPSFSIYPNPVKDVINIQGNIINGNIHLKICNALGQTVKNIILKDGQKQLSVADLVPAVYFIQIQADNGQIATKEFIKQ